MASIIGTSSIIPTPFNVNQMNGVYTTKPVPVRSGLSKKSPFVVARQSIMMDGKFDRVGFGNFDLLKPFFMRTKGTRGGLPTPVAMALLIGMGGKIIRNQVTGTQANNDILKHLKLIHYVPCIPMKAKGYFRTSKAGHDLLLLWVENDQKFKKFYDAFVSQNDIDRCVSWATMVNMGLPIPEIEDREKKAEKEMERINNQMLIQSQLANQYTYGQSVIQPNTSGSIQPNASMSGMFGDLF